VLGNAATATVSVTVNPVNDWPVLTNPLPNQLANANQLFSYTIAANAFSDVDGDELTLMATQADGSPLPSWLLFDSEGATFFRTPGLDDSVLLQLRVTVTDQSGASADGVIALSVLESTAIVGTSGNDNLSGTIQGELIQGLGGFDTLRGGPGADVLDGGDDVDWLDGEAGADVLLGGLGNDQLSGGAGNDLLEGGEGDDSLSDGDGADTVLGGAGNDYLSSGMGSDLLVGGDGDDQFSLLDGGDTADGGAGNDQFFVMIASLAGHTVTTGAGSDTVVLQSFGGLVVVTDFTAGAV